jgi:hypothetical protein
MLGHQDLQIVSAHRRPYGEALAGLRTRGRIEPMTESDATRTTKAHDEPIVQVRVAMANSDDDAMPSIA